MTSISTREESEVDTLELYEIQNSMNQRMEMFNSYFRTFGAEDIQRETFEGVSNELRKMLNLLSMFCLHFAQIVDRESGLKVVRAVFSEMTKVLARLDDICGELEASETREQPLDEVFFVDRKLSVQEKPFIRVLDLGEKQCRRVGCMPVANSNFGTATHHSKVYIVGGSSKGNWLKTCEFYDTESKLRRVCPEMKTGRARAGVGFHDGKMYVVAGYNGAYLKSVEVYDPEKVEWTQGPVLNKHRTDPSVVSLEGKLYVLGGYNGNTYEESIEWLNEQTRKFEIVGTMTGRSGFGACAFKGRIYVAGGWSTSNDTLRSVKSYDPKRNTWREEPPMRFARKYFTLHATNETIYAIRGCSNTRSIVEEIERLDMRTREWELFQNESLS